jgi:hypothetical protein
MLPTEAQIQQAAFDRWRRRGWTHGFDREDWFAAEDELKFSLNYQTIVEYPLDAPETLILSGRPARYCRFCERTDVQTLFGPATPVVAGALESSLLSEAICEECRSTFRSRLAEEFKLFQIALLGGATHADSRGGSRASSVYSIAVFKSLVACALTIMPERELRYFVDALEWVSNPASQRDAALLQEEALCLAYQAEFLRNRSWTSLARRTEHTAPFPYMIYFLAQGGVVLQVRLPLCVRDEDLDGRHIRLPRRSFTSRDDQPFAQARAWELRPGCGCPG